MTRKTAPALRAQGAPLASGGGVGGRSQGSARPGLGPTEKRTNSAPGALPQGGRPSPCDTLRGTGSAQAATQSQRLRGARGTAGSDRKVKGLSGVPGSLHSCGGGRRHPTHRLRSPLPASSLQSSLETPKPARSQAGEEALGSGCVARGGAVDRVCFCHRGRLLGRPCSPPCPLGSTTFPLRSRQLRV